MEKRSLEELVEDRVAQLDNITRRRNELLTEMYHLLQKRDSAGVLALDEDVTAGDVGTFLDRFDLLKHPDTGRIGNLPSDGFDLNPASSSTPALTTSEPSSGAPGPGSPASEGESSHDELDLVGAYSSADDMDVEDDLAAEQPPRKRARTSASSASSPADGKAEEDEEPDELDLIGTPAAAPRSREDRAEAAATPPLSPSPPAPSAPSSPPKPSVAVHHAPPFSSPVGQPSGWQGPPTSISLNPSPTLPSTSFPSASFAPVITHTVSGSAIPMPAPWTDPAPPFTFPGGPPEPDAATSPRRPLHAQQSTNLPYALPPLKLLPAEYSKKTKSSKARKREKERAPEKGEARREEYTPLGVNRWGATIRANPLWRRVGRASKCVSTREWGVALTEVKIMRALERIEMLKDAGKWSFRQVRRQRGVGGLTKTHGDHLLDEMRWMRIDFREERKWKLAIAHSLAHAAVEWHRAGSAEERDRLGICVRWVPPVDEPMGEAHSGPEVDMPLGVPGEPEEPGDAPQPLLDYASDQSEDEEQQDVEDVLDTGAAIQDALDAVEQPTTSSSFLQRTDDLQPKTEDFDDTSALRNSADNDAMIVDKAEETVEPLEDDGAQPKEEDSAALTVMDALRPDSTNPILGEVTGEQKPPSGKSAVYAPLRERIAHSADELLFLDENFIKLVITTPAEGEGRQEESDLGAPDLLAIFSDIMQPLDFLDVAPPPAPSDGKKKSDRKSDKDDPHKRAEDTTYTRLTPMSQFMSVKPTLLGPLKPAEHWKDGQWVGLDDIPVTTDNEVGPSKPAEENPCSLFQGPQPGRSPHGINTSLPGSAPEARRRAADYLWSANEDILLKSLTERYPGNWQLICDSFNSSRLAMSADKRSPWDCLERWRIKWGTSSHQPQPTPSELTPSAPSPETPSMMTRNVRRSVTANAAQRAVSTAPANASNGESKKRRRHNLMYDTIRKAAKKREATQKANANQRKAAAVHDTHGQVNSLPKRTPMELSRVKAEKDQREANEHALRQQQVRTEQLRQHALREHVRINGGMPMQAQLLQQQQQQLQQQNAAARQNAGPAQQPQNVPQIRGQVNISQQQRTGTPLAAATARMLPQQVYQAQAQAAQVAQARALAAAQAALASAPINGAVPNGVSHLSPPYVARAASGSPAMQQASAIQVANSNSPRPPSAQAAAPAPAAAVQRPAQNIAHYFPSMPNGPTFTHDQVLGLQALLARQQGMSQGTQPHGATGFTGQQ